MVCASEKYASDIEIFTFGRGFRTRISRNSVQKRHFHQSMIRQFGKTDCFQQNRPIAAIQNIRYLPEADVFKCLLRPIAKDWTALAFLTFHDPRRLRFNAHFRDVNTATYEVIFTIITTCSSKDQV